MDNIGDYSYFITNENDMKRFYFTGDIETIIELFKFEKVPQLKFENEIYESYEFIVNGFKGEKSKIEITIEHHSEKEDVMFFEFVSNILGTGHHIRIDIQSVIDLTMFIKTIQ